MRQTLARVALGLAVFAGMTAQAADASDSVTICLNKDNAPFSFNKENGPGGFDYLMAQAVSKKLGRKLEVKWYEKERRSRGPVSVKTSVLINGGVCQLVGGFPLIVSSLERPNGESTTLPPVDGMAAESRKQVIKGSQLISSSPYHFAGITVIFGAAVPLQKLDTLDQLKPYKIGNRPASIGDLITMAYKKGLLMTNVMHVGIQDEPLDALSKAQFDITLIESHKFDAYVQENPKTTLRGSQMILPVGFNLGFVTTAEHAELLAAVSAAVDAMIKNGEAEKVARAAGLTFIAPLTPSVRSGLGLEQLTQ